MGAIDYEPVFDVTNTFCFSKLYGMKGHTSYLELSTYTYFHHKSLDIPWLEQDKWNKAQAQLFHTAHVDYHPIFEWLHFDINWHIPHHVSVKIPW